MPENKSSTAQKTLTRFVAVNRPDSAEKLKCNPNWQEKGHDTNFRRRNEKEEKNGILKDFFRQDD